MLSYWRFTPRWLMVYFVSHTHYEKAIYGMLTYQKCSESLIRNKDLGNILFETSS